MSIKLSAKERKEIIIDHLQGIPNKLYEVKELSNGTYRVTRVQVDPKVSDSSDEHEAVPDRRHPSSPCGETVCTPDSLREPPKPKLRSIITNEDIMMKLTELYENQNRVPQKPPPESSTPRPPIDSTVEEETVRSLSSPSRPVPMKPTTGRRRLVLG